MKRWEVHLNGDAAVANIKQILVFGAGLFCAGCVMLATSLIWLTYFFG